MDIKNIYLHNYRNYQELNLNLSPNINIFTGFNAQGKTNIIEAIHFASIGISHRTRTENDLIYWNSNQANIQIKFSKMDIISTLKFNLNKQRTKEINLNGETIKQRELPGLLTMVLFSPEDLMLIKGSPLLRRRFLDIELSQVGSIYYNELVKYNKLLFQRNTLLKKIRENNSDRELLDIWDNQFAKCAGFITEKRLKGIYDLNNLIKDIHKWITQGTEGLNIKYIIHKQNNNLSTDSVQNYDGKYLEKWYLDNLKKYQNSDIFRGTTSIGPHRDDISFFINDIDLKSFGSQGQQRSCVLSLKLAEMEFLKQETGEYPVLLLDDVMSELDTKRRQNLLALLQEKNIQTLITATDRELFNDNIKNKFFTVNHGNVI